MRYFVAMTLVAAGCLLSFGEGRGCAQGIPPRPGIGVGPVTTPAYSPYLNLLRSGSFMQNYWGLVQPELQWRGAVQSLDQQVTANAQAIGALQTTPQGIPVTGHATRFMSTGSYFPPRGARSAR